MKIDCNQILLNLKGKPILDNDKDEKSTVSLKTICQMVLLNGIPNENIEGKRKFELWKIAEKIENCQEEVELDAEEISTIKDRVGKLYPPLLVGSVYTALEGKVKK